MAPADASASTTRELAATTPASRLKNVKDFGAAGDGVKDDTRAIQAAIDAAGTGCGATVLFPAGTYLLNSHSPSRHPWFFYNLLVGSNVVLQGETGAKLLQAPGGRHAVLHDATEVRNTVLAFGADYVNIRFQDPKYNGGFYTTAATVAGSTRVALATPGNARHFAVGDYVAIYKSSAGDAIPSETSRIVSVDPATGVIGLSYPLARSFTAPGYIANVSAVATHHVGIKNLVVQGTEPLAITEAFEVDISDSQFIADTSVGGTNTYSLNINTVHGARFINNVFTSTAAPYAGHELPQRNSQDVVFEGNTFHARFVGFGEYGARWKLVKNVFNLYPDDRTPVALFIGGLDVLFDGNTITSTSLTAGDGSGGILADTNGPDGYSSYVGQIRITNNRLTGLGSGNNGLILRGPDTIVTGNTVTLAGSLAGLKVESTLQQHVQITANTFVVGSGDGVIINTRSIDGSTISNNNITGAGGQHGIYGASPTIPNTGAHTISGNSIAGFVMPIYPKRPY